MKHNMYTAGILLAFFLFIFTGQIPVSAQEDAALKILSAQKRPVPAFDHDLHIDTLGESECGSCHHIFDEEKNMLVYSEGYESACSDCHESESNNTILSLKDASHKSCTGCHRRMKKADQPTGPTTCGECHKK